MYVALSRCRTLEGISLESPIRASSIYSDLHVSDFNDTIQAGSSTARENLETEERSYTYNIYREIFDFGQVCNNLEWVKKIWRERLQEIYEPEYTSILKWNDLLDQLKKTGDTFQLQLTRIETSALQDEGYLNERLLPAYCRMLSTP